MSRERGRLFAVNICCVNEKIDEQSIKLLETIKIYVRVQCIYMYLYYLACDDELDDMDFFEDVVDMPNEIPLVINAGSVISLTESLRSDTLQSCPNFEGDIRMDFLFD